jgi:hypothetical protein
MTKSLEWLAGNRYSAPIFEIKLPSSQSSAPESGLTAAELSYEPKDALVASLASAPKLGIAAIHSSAWKGRPAVQQASRQSPISARQRKPQTASSGGRYITQNAELCQDGKNG